MTKRELIFTRIFVILIGLGLPLMIVGRCLNLYIMMCVGIVMTSVVVTTLFITVLASLWKGY